MNQSLDYQDLSPTAGAGAQVIEPFAPEHNRTPLETLIHLLAGSADATLADSGITRLSRRQLDSVSGNAQEQSENSLEHALLLLRLLEHTLENHCPPSTNEMLAMAQHITSHLQNHKRWNTLADNAAYYRDHPEIASRIAALRKLAMV